MANENRRVALSSTALHVIEQFAAAMRADDQVDDHSIDRLETLLRKGVVPKPDEINAALFDPPAESER